MTTTSPQSDEPPAVLDRFLDQLRRTGTAITDASPGEPESPWVDPPLEWPIEAHRGTPLDPPYRLRLDAEELAEALERDAQLIAEWWPGGDPAARARDALLLSFDTALSGLARSVHGFVVRGEDRLELTAQQSCPDPIAHLDPSSTDYTWSAYEPGTPEFDRELAEQGRRSRHRRHSYLVLGWLEVEAADENGERMDAAMGYLQDALGAAFGNEVFARFSAYVEEHGSPTTVELSRVMHAEDERFDAFLDALAGEPRED